jgi:4-amino-4-deoxy-L-arabinose transferase-like glycosyltransferase
MSNLFESRKVFWLLLALCFGIKIYMFFSTYVIARDSVQYMGMAELFLEGRFLAALEYITPPFYPLLLAGMKLVISDPEIAGKLVSLLLGTCTFFPLYYLGKRFFEQKVVFIGLLLFAIHPYLVRYSAEILSESTFIFLSITGFWLLWMGWEEKHYVFCALAGLALGLSCLTRAQGLIWIGAILAVPIIFSFVKQKTEIKKGNLWISFLLAAFVFLIIIFPYSYFLKQLTGEWTVRQIGAPALWEGTGHSSSQGLWETLMALLGHPWLLVKKLGWNMGRLAPLLPETIHYPFFVLLVIGLVAWRHTKRYLKGELYLAIICLVYILGHCLLYLKVRYLLPIVPFALFWAGQGFWATATWLNRFCARYVPKIREQHRVFFVIMFLICIVAGSTLPKTLEPQRREKLDRKEVGKRIATLFPNHPTILASDPRIAFYANGEIVIPRKIMTFTEMLKYVRNDYVDVIVMNKKRVDEEGRDGDLARDFFAHSNHPDLQLLFVYPSDNEQANRGGSSLFYVYRFVGEKNQPAR